MNRNQTQTLLKIVGLTTIVLALGIPARSDAAIIGRLLKFTGNVRLIRGGKGLTPKEKEEIQWGDEMKGEIHSQIWLWLPRQEIVLNGPFQITLEKSTGFLDVSIVQLHEGQMRMKTRNIRDGGRATRVARTANATISVTGNSDFVAIYSAIYQESELFSYEHSPDLIAIENSSARSVEPWHWAGIGGRFGSIVRPTLRLKSEIFSHLKSNLPLEEGSPGLQDAP